jgi:putative phosphoserine phosphatase/1-acylglycerol-3-phosphate O-acyltransferase
MTHSPTLRLPGSLAEVQHSPEGPEIGAFFDLDGTLVAGFTATVLTIERFRNRDIGVGELLRMLRHALDYKRGKVEFELLVREGVRPLAGRPAELLDRLGEELFRTKIADLVYPEMRELVRAHHERGHTVVLSSSALSIQVEPVARYLGIERVLCNRFVVDGDGLLTGEVAEPLVWAGGKSTAVQEYAREHGVDIQRSYFYADGDEDLPLMYHVGHPRPTNPGRRMARVADRRGWPVLRFTSRGASGVPALARTALSLGSAVPIGAVGVAKGVATGDKWAGLNVLLRSWPRLVMDINGVKLRIVDEHNAFVRRPAVFIFNHRNNIDPLIAAAVVRESFTGVAKKELESSPLVGPFGRLTDIAFIDRADATAAVATLDQVGKSVDKGLSILIAPEGTRTDTTTVGPFKKGPFRVAMKAGVPLVPIVIRNAEYVAGRNATTINPGVVDVAVLPPIPVDDWTLRDLPARIDEVRQLFIDTLTDWPEGGVIA